MLTIPSQIEYLVWCAGVVTERVREAHLNKSAPMMMLFPGCCPLISLLQCYHFSEPTGVFPPNLLIRNIML